MSAARVGARKAAPLIAASLITLTVAVFGSPGEQTQLWMLTTGIAAGLPHGALDVLTAEASLKPGLGQRWRQFFIAAYLGAVLLIVAFWVIAPGFALTGLLTLASFHFGEGFAHVGPMRPLRTLAHGLAPIVIPAWRIPALSRQRSRCSPVTPMPG